MFLFHLPKLFPKVDRNEIRPPESENVGEEEGEAAVVVEPPDVDEPGVGLVGEHLDAGHVLRGDEVAVVPAEHGHLQRARIMKPASSFRKY